MSRTRKGRKSPGLEWSRKREGEKGWTTPGTFAKRQAHRAERRAAKVAAQGKDAAGENVGGRSSRPLPAATNPVQNVRRGAMFSRPGCASPDALPLQEDVTAPVDPRD